MLISSFLKRSSSWIRSACSMSPWIWPAAKPVRFRLVASSRTVVLRLQKTIAFLTSSPRSSSTQRVLLLARVDPHHALVDQHVGRGRARHLDRLGIGEELVGQLLDRRRHRRREQQGLPVFGSLVQISSMSGMKPMSSIRSASSMTSRLQPVSRILPRPNRSISRPGRGDQHVDALLERLDLVAHRHAADQQRHRELVMLAVFLEILGDLGGELAGRLEDQRARHARAAAALRQDVDHRQHEAGGLAGAGLGDADDVAPHQHRRDRLALDRRRARYSPTSLTARSNSSERPRSAKVMQVSGSRALLRVKAAARRGLMPSRAALSSKAAACRRTHL